MDLSPCPHQSLNLAIQGANSGQSRHVSLWEGCGIAQGRAAPAHTSPPHLHYFFCCRTNWDRAAQLLQVWSHPVMLNLFSSPCSHPLSTLWREEVNPLPYNSNNEVIGPHDKHLASSRSTLHGEVRQAEIRREGLGVINQLAQGISFWFTSAMREGKRKASHEPLGLSVEVHLTQLLVVSPWGGWHWGQAAPLVHPMEGDKMAQSTQRDNTVDLPGSVYSGKLTPNGQGLAPPGWMPVLQDWQVRSCSGHQQWLDLALR